MEVIEKATYKPFGEQSEWLSPTQGAPESKGWIGERFDADAGLQYLNARYYDPELGMFLQPDWFEVTKAGVGTNRYAYCTSNPINCLDPSGNSFWSDLKDAWGAFKDAVSGKATHIDNAGQHKGGAGYGYVRAGGKTYGCFGCGGTGTKGRDSALNAAAYAAVRPFANRVSKSTNGIDIDLSTGSAILKELGGSVILLPGNGVYGWIHIVKGHGNFLNPLADPTKGQFYPHVVSSQRTFFDLVVVNGLEGYGNHYELRTEGNKSIIESELPYEIGVASPATGGGSTNVVRFVTFELMPKVHSIITAYPIVSPW